MLPASAAEAMLYSLVSTLRCDDCQDHSYESKYSVRLKHSILVYR